MFTKIKELRIKELSLELNELLGEKQENKEKIQEKYIEYEEVMNATNFKDLGMDFKEAVRFLHRENKPAILEKEDNIENPEKHYQKLQDFI